MSECSNKRCFLLLQGPLSPLYARLADVLKHEGHGVHRINLCIGDRLHWGARSATSYRGPLAGWGEYVEAFLEDNGITDLILHGDRRPYHKIAAERARQLGVQVIVTELGYLRPDWMTLERNATSAGSHFPTDPAHIRRIAAQVAEVDLAPLYDVEFFKVAAPDVIYNLANSLLWFLYPHYRRHTIYYPPIEYAAWLVRLASARARQRAAERAIAQVAARTTPFFVFLMQLEGDFQIRDHSPFAGLGAALEHVMTSFASHAPSEAVLFVKAHPLDNGLHRWGRLISHIGERLDVKSRVHFLDGGPLNALLGGAKGVITVNSSAGLEALSAGCPTKVLGPAIYDVPGLTCSGELHSFWNEPKAPDAPLLRDFIRALAGTVQVRGNIYSDAGLEAAVKGMAEKILDGRLNQPDAWVAAPPRALPGIGSTTR